MTTGYPPSLRSRWGHILGGVCGIAGKASVSGGIERSLIETMCAQQAHRGPDARGIHRADAVALGIQRLRVIDLETGDQPIYNEDRSVAVVLNGEIYNYRELRRDLERRGHEFKTDGDTEVIAHLYEERGARAVSELLGMFAFAIWDERAQTLVLGRDRVGKKPLFYFEGDGWITFASELNALMVDPAIPRQLDPSSVDAYLGLGYIPAPWSIWQDVCKLPPAHVMVWEKGHARVDEYWRLDYSRTIEAPPQELEEELRQLVGAAVKRRLIADVPLGAFLSGGLDSSVVVAEMAEASTRPIETFSIGFDHEAYNELPKARAVAESFGTHHHEFTVSTDIAELAPRIASQYGEPFADSSAIPSFRLAELASDYVTVALNGDGGDESFAGYPRHLANSAGAFLDRVPPSVRRLGSATGARLPRTSGGKSRLNYARRFLEHLEEGAPARYARHISIFNPEERRAVLGANRDWSAERGVEKVVRDLWESTSARSRLDTLLDVDVKSYLPGDLLVKIDIACMAYSLEGRSPLLDHTVMEFAASLPSRSKAGLLEGKRILTSAYRERLPDTTLRGAKMGFAVPLSDWFRGELRDLAHDALLDDSAKQAGLVDPAGVRTLLFEHERHERDNSAKLWALLMLELWRRDSQSSEKSLATSGAQRS